MHVCLLLFPLSVIMHLHFDWTKIFLPEVCGSSVLNRVCGTYIDVEYSRIYCVIHMCAHLFSSETQIDASFGVLQHWREFTDSSWVIAHLNGKRRNGMVSQRDYQRWDFPFHMWNVVAPARFCFT